jgi:hypothetical protein
MYPPVLLYFNKIIKKEKFFDMSSPIFPIFWSPVPIKSRGLFD